MNDVVAQLEDNDFCEAVQKNRKIDAIKRLRKMYDLGIKEAYDLVIPNWDKLRQEAFGLG